MEFEWVDEIEDGWVWGRIMRNGAEVEFHVPLLCLSDSARVDIQPGSYITILNGDLAVNNAIWTTHDMEEADKEAMIWKALFASGEIIETL
jgi:hypothetical protein